MAQEAADLIYFAMVKCASSGVTLADVEDVLDKRGALKPRGGLVTPSQASWRRPSRP